MTDLEGQLPDHQLAAIPASTNFGTTGVGTMALRRFLRRVRCENLPYFCPLRVDPSQPEP